MKKLLLVGMLVLSGLSFARDYTHNEKRDIVAPMEEMQERASRLSQDQFNLEGASIEANIEKYSGFHSDLDNMDRGENSQR